VQLHRDSLQVAIAKLPFTRPGAADGRLTAQGAASAPRGYAGFTATAALPAPRRSTPICSKQQLSACVCRDWEPARCTTHRLEKRARDTTLCANVAALKHRPRAEDYYSPASETTPQEPCYGGMQSQCRLVWRALHPSVFRHLARPRLVPMMRNLNCLEKMSAAFSKLRCSLSPGADLSMAAVQCATRRSAQDLRVTRSWSGRWRMCCHGNGGGADRERRAAGR